MQFENLEFRRATVDDREALMELWRHAGKPAEELERRLTEFQLALDPEDHLLAAIALHRADQQGRIHSETYWDPDSAPQLRPQLANRILRIAKNYGLLRLWTTATDPVWQQLGFRPAEAYELEKFPPAFGNWKLDWYSLKLREDLASAEQIDKEFQLFRLTNQQDHERLIRRARIFKSLALTLAILMFVLLLVFLFYLGQYYRTRA